MRIFSRLALVGAAMMSFFAAASQAQLIHRYSFTSDGSDSIGALDWAANGGAMFTGGEVVFDGVDDYLGMPTNPLPSSGNATIEVWGAYDPTTAPGSRIFDFATSNGDFYFYTTPNANTQGIRVGWDDNLNGGNSQIGPVDIIPANTGAEVLLTVVLDSTNNVIQLYRGGVLLSESSGEGLPLLDFISGINDAQLGHGVSNTVNSNPEENQDPPAFLTGSINELRIYNTALSSQDILTNAISGPDITSVTLTDRNWTAGSGTWSTASNWTGATLPSAAERAVISNGGTATVSSAVADVGSASVTSGTLAVAAGGSLNVQYPIQLGAGASISVAGGGELGVSGVLASGGAGARTLSVDGGVIRAPLGTAVIEQGVTLEIAAGGATIDTQGGVVAVSSEITGDGVVTVVGGGTLRARGDINLAPGEQNPGFSGSWHVQDSVVDVRGTHGVLGTGAEDGGSQLHLENSTLLINTAVTTSINFKRVPIDIEATGQNEIINNAPFDNTFRYQGSLTGDGEIRYTVPFSPTPIGLDFEDRENPDDPESPFVSDNSGFTGRFIVDDDTATRFFSTPITDELGTIIGYERRTDFPNAIFDMAGDGAWTGKRGTDEDQLIQLGGLAGVGPDEDLQTSSGGLEGFGSRLEASIAASGDVGGFADVTYELGGAAEDAEFFGTVRDTPFTGGVDVVTIVKVGDNTQALSGINSYSGTTTINGGTLLVNGVHAQTTLAAVAPNDYDGNPVGDYTVNAGGTLGGDGVIGSATDGVDVSVAGALNPGSEVGELTVNGNVTFASGSTFIAEILGTSADKLVVTGSLNLSGSETLDVSLLGSVTPGDYVIAEFGSLVGVFDIVPSGYSVSYDSGQIVVSVTDAGGLTGDYNSDGVVDATDYAVWREALGTTASLPNDPIGGTIGAAHFDQWQTNFGASSAAVSSIAKAPEPGAALILLAWAPLYVALRRQRSHHS